MARELPMACTLDTTALERRLEQISAIGADGFIGASKAGDRNVLRFRPDGEIRRRLEEIVAAEAECCSFLDLEVEDGDGELILTIDAPPQGRDVAAALATAFAASAD